MKNLYLMLFVTLLFASLCFSQNYSIEFDGIDDFGKTSQVANVSNNFTIEFWAKPTAEDLIVNEGVTNDIGLRMVLHPTHGTSNWGSGHAGVGVTVATNTITVNEHAANYLISTLVWVGTITGWNHIAVVYENKTPRLYVNGILVHTGITSSYNYIHPSLGYDGYPGYINNNGIGTGMGGGHYIGYLDEMRMSDIIRYTSNFTPQLTFSNDANTIGLYHFNEGTGNIFTDNSNNANGGNLYGPIWSTDVPPIQTNTIYSLSFDGVNDYVDIPYDNIFNLATNFTIEAFVKIKPQSLKHNSIVSKNPNHGWGSGWELTYGQYNVDGFSFMGSPGGVNTTAFYVNPDFEKWYHIAGVYDGSKFRIFVDGQLDTISGTTNIAGAIASNTLSIVLGRRSELGSNTHFLDGLIESVRYSNIVRYTDVFTPPKSLINDINTVGLWNIDEGSGNIIYDASGNGNNGTINGATWSSDVPPSQTTSNYSLKLNWNNALTGNHMEVPFSSSINSYFNTQKLTISVWYKPLARHSGWNWYVRKSIGGCQDDFAFGHSQLDLDNYSYLMLGNPRSCTGDQFLEVFQTGFQIGEWQHVETNYDVLNGKAQIYVNGQLKAETNSFSDITANNIVTYILMGMNGLIDELHFSNNIRHIQNFTPLSEEIADQNTIFLFKMNEGSGNILVDASSNHNDAAIINPSYVEEWSTDVPLPPSPILTTTWQAEIRVADAGGLDASNILTFGQDSTATDSVDAALGEYELPPLPPTGVFDTRFILPTTPTIGSLSDYRNINDISIVWVMTFQPSSSDYPFTFTWSSDSLPQIGNFFLKDFFGLVNVDMRTQNSYTLTNPAINSLKIEYERTYTKDVNIQQGWNILSAPVNALDMTANTLFPGATSYFFGYNNGYQIEDTLKNSKGYWAKFGSSHTYQITGNLVYPPNVTVNSYWNLVGPFNFDVPVSDITSTPAGIIATNFFGFNNGYQIADTLKVGQGYWVRSSQSGTLHLNNLLNAPTSDMQTAMALLEANFTVTDGAGGTTLLIAGIDSLATDGLDPLLGEFEIPPLPPAGVFDARFNLPSSTISSLTEIRQGTFAGGFNRIHEMQYQVGAGAGIVINYDFGSYAPDQVKGRLQDIVTGTLIDTTVSGMGSYTVPNPSVFNKLKLTMIYGTSIPVELTSFSASSIDKDVNLQWTTATETNNSGFSIERKIKNENSWSTVSFVDGRGTTTDVTDYSYTDKNVPAGIYNYRLKQIDFDGSYEYSNIIEVEVSLPKTYSLGNCYPNPFNPSTIISYEVPKQSNVLLKVYDILGNEVATLVNEEKSEGSYQIIFDASALSNGVYFYRLQSGNFVETKKMILVK